MNNVTSGGNYVRIKELFVITCAQSFLFCANLIEKVINYEDYMKLAQINQWCVYYVWSAPFPVSYWKKKY